MKKALTLFLILLSTYCFSQDIRGSRFLGNRLNLDRNNNINSAGPIWQHTDRPYSPFLFTSTDTLTANEVDPPNINMPLSGVFARRTMYYADGIRKTQKIYGHYMGMTYNWLDSMTFKTEAGDYNQGMTIELSLEPRGTGKQATGIHGTGNQSNPWYGTAALLSNTIYRSSDDNYIRTNGWMVGISSYLVMSGGQTDTADAFSFYQTNNFINTPAHVKKAFGFDLEHTLSGARIDSSFGFWDRWGYRHWLRGSTVIGTLADSSVTGYQLKVSGQTYLNGMVQGRQGGDVASTAGVMTLGQDGNVTEITGTNTITAIANTNKKNGFIIRLLFTSTATLTDGTANSGDNIGMELAGNTNFTASAGDVVTLVLAEIGGTQRWREVSRSDN